MGEEVYYKMLLSWLIYTSTGHVDGGVAVVVIVKIIFLPSDELPKLRLFFALNAW